MLKEMTKILLILLSVTLLNASVDDYSLTIKVDKKEIYLGDELNLKLIFKYIDLEDYELPEIKIKNFEIKELNSLDYKQDNGSYIEEVNYKLVPQKSGKFEIGNFEVEIEIISKNYKNLNNRSKYIKKILINSNTLNLNIKGLPEGISVIGNYTLNAKVDKQKIKAGKIVTFTIELQGVGNVRNLDAMKLKIENATSFLVMSSKNSKKAFLSKTFEIIADNSYIIPAFTLEYFNKELGIKKTTQSKPFHINVINSKKIKTSAKHIVQNREKIIFFLIGMFSAFCIILFYNIYRKIKFQKNDSNLIKLIQNTKNKNDLYKKLVIFLGINEKLDILIYILEKDKKINLKKIKKEAIKIVKEIELKLNEE